MAGLHQPLHLQIAHRAHSTSPFHHCKHLLMCPLPELTYRKLRFGKTTCLKVRFSEACSKPATQTRFKACSQLLLFLQIAQPPFFPMTGFVTIIPFAQGKEGYYHSDPNDINYQKAVTILCSQKIKRHTAVNRSCFSQGVPFDQNESSRYYMDHIKVNDIIKKWNPAINLYCCRKTIFYLFKK